MSDSMWGMLMVGFGLGFLSGAMVVVVLAMLKVSSGLSRKEEEER